MKSFLCVAAIVIGVAVLVSVTGQGCTSSDNRKEKMDSLTIKKTLSSPLLSPEESMKKIQVEHGFALELVAAEPLVVAPVAMTFDEKGRIWVVEMYGYMPDTLGTGENEPTGKIVLLNDKNGDGKMDERTVFLDSLILPRSVCLVENGILVGAPPNLWYYEIKNDQPVKKSLVDKQYTIGGNPEHEPNGLFRALDNWIYNAKFDKRYRKKGDHWLIEKTHFRGQWGITQDDYGRLFYNLNSVNLLGDYFSPGMGAANDHQKEKEGFSEEIVDDNRVYPVAPTPGVNRGYQKGVLDDSLRLESFTAACGPVIYRGHLFPEEYRGNAFVAEPAGNLIKRDILNENGYVIQGRQAYEKKEFLAGLDERFRPVSLYNGPDGALYVVDMYRGIIQHKVYLTGYLKSEIKDRNLTQPLNCGRIYKIVPQNKKAEAVGIINDPDGLVRLLSHANGWVRDKAQQLLIDGKWVRVAPALQDLLKESDKPLTVIHAMWTLEGLGVLKAEDVLLLLQQANWIIRQQALSVLPSVMDRNNYKSFLSACQQLVDRNDTLAAPYIGFLASKVQSFDPAAANQLLFTLSKKYPDNIFVASAIISNLENKESVFYRQLATRYPNDSLSVKKELREILNDMAAAGTSKVNLAEKLFPRGARIYKSICHSCHGDDGNGIKLLAPPLNKSNWVLGDKNKLVAIVLYGLTGPVTVSGKEYKAPEISGEMPGIAGNREFSDEDIAQLISFIRNSWSNKADKVTISDVDYVRNRFKGRQTAFTAEELNNIK